MTETRAITRERAKIERPAGAACAERNAKYWTLHEAVERLFKTIADEKREEGR